jgi:hypothetical protein
MRNIVTRLLPAGLVVLLAVALFGCGLVEPLIKPSALNYAQAIALIQVSGVPYIDQYYKETVGEETAQEAGEIGPVTPTGDWTADYNKDKSEWLIKGPVITKSWGECLTTWTLSEADGKIHLIGFKCD